MRPLASALLMLFVVALGHLGGFGLGAPASRPEGNVDCYFRAMGQGVEKRQHDQIQYDNKTTELRGDFSPTCLMEAQSARP